VWGCITTDLGRETPAVPRPPRPRPAGDALVAGVDGCRAGWVVAVTAAEGPAPIVSIDVVAHIGEVFDRVRSGELVAVGLDMPIGLPDAGPRACDDLTRRRLGPRRSSVFPTPPRPVLGSADHAEALRRSRAIDGRGISIQAFNLLPKIAEVDAAIDPGLADAVVEAHPESAFAELAGAPLLTTKRTAEGRSRRLALLARPFPRSADLLTTRLRGAAADDVLDAAAAAWSARRWATGTAIVLGDGTLDGRGLPMRVAV
jgi:predicted RNase H-like nuclease